MKYLIALTLLFSSMAQAQNLLTLRVHSSFDEAMITVKQTLNSHGYKVAHIQKCDGGLHGMGYKTDDYKLVFFGKLDEIRKLSKEHPKIIPYLPLKMAVIKENDSVILTSVNPETLANLFNDKSLDPQFKMWAKDLNSVFHEISHHIESLPSAH